MFFHLNSETAPSDHTIFLNRDSKLTVSWLAQTMLEAETAEYQSRSYLKFFICLLQSALHNFLVQQQPQRVIVLKT